MASNYEPEYQQAYVGVRSDSIGPALDPPLSSGKAELAIVEERSHYAYVERRQDLEPLRQDVAKYRRGEGGGGAGNVTIYQRKYTPTVALDPPPPRVREGAMNVGVRKDNFSPTLDPPSRFPAAGGHTIDSLSKSPDTGAQCSRCGSHVTYYETEANYSAHRTEPLCIPCSGSSHAITPPSSYPTYPPTVYAGPVGPYPNHVPPPSGTNGSRPAKVRYTQDKTGGCGCVIL
jgi:hypothetical protein